MKEQLRRRFPRAAASAAYLKALYENEIELRLLPYLCDTAATSVDVGAFTGLYAYGMTLYSRRVVAIEPQPRQSELLRRSMPAAVEVIEAAASDVSAQGFLEMNSLAGGSMSRVVADGGASAGRVAHPIRLVRLDDVVPDRVSFIKIDAEGHELEVLAGARRLIQEHRPSFVIEAEERVRPGAVGSVAAVFTPLDYAALFVYRKQLCPLAAFDGAVHQDESLFREGPRTSYEDYVANIIFVPGERAGALPKTMPSASSAVRRSLLAATGAAQPRQQDAQR